MDQNAVIICLDIIPRLRDNEKLKTIFYTVSSDIVRDVAFKRITEQETLEAIATNQDTNCDLLGYRLAAIGKITNQEILERLACSGENSEVRIAAIKRIDNQEYLEKIFEYEFRKNCDYKVLKAILRALRDEKIFERIAMNEEYPEYLRAEAVDHISQNVLALSNIAFSSGSEEVREHAMNAFDVLRKIYYSEQIRI